jgi:hypothetical protein
MGRAPGVLVVAAWSAANAALLAVLLLYGESALALWLWAAVVALVELAALEQKSDPGADQHVCQSHHGQEDERQCGPGRTP